MNRRKFLQRIGAAVIGLTLARHLPGIAPAPAVLPPPTSFDLTSDEFAERYLKPAVDALANQIDREILAMMTGLA